VEEGGRKVYGARKVWQQLNREGIAVARCTVERLMGELGIAGACAQRKRPRTTLPAESGERPADLLERGFDTAASQSRPILANAAPDSAALLYVDRHGLAVRRRAPRLDAPDGPVLTTATVNATAGNNAFASTSVPITDPGGTRKLYLVFQTVLGGPAGGFGNLNWVEFAGQGLGVTPQRRRRVVGRPAGAPPTAQIA
jgi:transposase InsO family protein